MNNPLGKHLLLDLFHCQSDALCDQEKLDQILTECVRLVGATIVQKVFHPFEPEGSGVSIVFVLAESHLSLHSWPEDKFRYVSIDMYTCGQCDPMKMLSYIKDQLKPTEVKEQLIIRGLADERMRESGSSC